jgi:hypothetical protein
MRPDMRSIAAIPKQFQDFHDVIVPQR